MLPAASAQESASTGAAIQNQVPELVEWTMTVDDGVALFIYEVHAADGNGIEDLDRIVFRFFDEEGNELGRHVDTDATFEGRSHAVWDGTTPLPETDGAFIDHVRLDIHDAYGAVTSTDRPYTTVDRVRDASPEPVREALDSTEDEPEPVGPGGPIDPTPLSPLSGDVQILAHHLGPVVWALGVTLTLGLLVATIGRRTHR